MHRSKTAEDYFSSTESRINFSSAGLSEKYCTKYNTRLCSIELLNWADKIFVMEPMHAERIYENTGKQFCSKLAILDIADEYQYMQPELLDKLKSHPLLSAFIF